MAQPSSIAHGLEDVLPDGGFRVADMTTTVENDDWVLIVDAVILVSFRGAISSENRSAGDVYGIRGGKSRTGWNMATSVNGRARPSSEG